MLGLRLRSARKATDRWRKGARPLLTQEYAAKCLKIRQSYLSRIENGKADVSFLDVERMVYFYGLKSLDLVGTLLREEQQELHHNRW